MSVPKSPARWSLKTKFALCSGALMFAFSVAFTTWTLRTVEADVRGSVLDAQRTLVRSTADDLDAKVELRRDAMTTIAPLLALAAPAPGAAMETFFKPRPVLQKMFDAVLVVDAGGQVVHQMPDLSALACSGPNVAGQDYFKRALAGEALVISAPFRASADGQPCVVFAAPLRPPGGRPTGALLGVLRLVQGRFLGPLGQLRIGREGYFALVERAPVPLYVMHRQHELIAQPAPGGNANPMMVQATKGLEGAFEGVGATGLAALRTFKPLRSVPWVLVAVYPTDEAYATLRDRQKEVLAVGTGLFFAASLLAWMLTGWLLRPLTRLQALMDRHGAEPGAPLAPESFGSTELAALVDAYNSQASKRREFEDRLRASERRMQRVLDNIPARVGQYDLQGRFIYVNRYTGPGFRDDPHQMLGRTLREIRGEQAYEQIAPTLARVLAGEVVQVDTAGEDEGRTRQYQSHYVPEFDAAGRVCGYFGMAFDITDLKDAQARQAQVEERLRAITDNLPVLISYVGSDERYRFMNATFRDWLGIDPAAALGRTMREVLGEEVYQTRRDPLRRCLAGERVDFDMEPMTLQGLKKIQIVYIPDRRPDGSVAGFYTLGSDVTALKDAQLRLALLAHSDPLTGLPNRFQFNLTLPLALQRCVRLQRGLALMFLDVDYFKRINDTRGHAAGDIVLREVAQRLLGSVRTTDTVARLGGDEFVVIAENLRDQAEAEHVARKILREMRTPFDIEGSPQQVGVSIGVAYTAHLGVGPKDLLAQADVALYEVKARGRNDYSVVAV